jgi:hypothetical protein
MKCLGFVFFFFAVFSFDHSAFALNFDHCESLLKRGFVFHNKIDEFLIERALFKEEPSLEPISTLVRLHTDDMASVMKEKPIYAYRGLRLTLRSLQYILKNGFSPEKTMNGLTYVAAQPGDSISYALFPAGSYPRSNYVVAVFQLDRSRIPGLEGLDGLQTEAGSTRKRIPPEVISGVYVFDRFAESVRSSFVEIARQGR